MASSTTSLMRSTGAVSGAGSVSVAWPTLVGVETSRFEVHATGLAEVCFGVSRAGEAFGQTISGSLRKLRGRQGQARLA
jgi:hypothetical protein